MCYFPCHVPIVWNIGGLIKENFSRQEIVLSFISVTSLGVIHYATVAESGHLILYALGTVFYYGKINVVK